MMFFFEKHHLKWKLIFYIKNLKLFNGYVLIFIKIKINMYHIMEINKPYISCKEI
jgi:hypothetical protein